MQNLRLYLLPCCPNASLYVTETKVLNVFAATKRLRPSPLFFRLSSNAFPDIGSVGRNEKKNTSKKITRSLGIGGPGTPG